MQKDLGAFPGPQDSPANHTSNRKQNRATVVSRALSLHGSGVCGGRRRLAAHGVPRSSPRSKCRVTSGSAPRVLCVRHPRRVVLGACRAEAWRLGTGQSLAAAATAEENQCPRDGARRPPSPTGAAASDGSCRTDTGRCFCFLPFFVKAKIPSDFSQLAKTDSDVGLWEKRGAGSRLAQSGGNLHLVSTCSCVLI